MKFNPIDKNNIIDRGYDIIILIFTLLALIFAPLLTIYIIGFLMHAASVKLFLVLTILSFLICFTLMLKVVFEMLLHLKYDLISQQIEKGISYWNELKKEDDFMDISPDIFADSKVRDIFKEVFNNNLLDKKNKIKEKYLSRR